MNIKKLFRTLVNFLVPTPATVRRHRAPSARFRTLEALAASRGDTLTRDGRSYTLTTPNSHVLEFDNLAQVKSYLGELNLGCIAPQSQVVVSGTHCFGPNPMRAVPATIETAGSCERALPNKVYDVACKALDESDRPDGGPYPGDADYVERPRNMFKIGALSPAVAQGDTYDIGSPPIQLGDPKFMDGRPRTYQIRPNGTLAPGPASDVGSAKPFVPVVATPITNDIVRE